MTAKRKQPKRGLERVVAADTALSFVDGVNGKLYYRGYDIELHDIRILPRRSINGGVKCHHLRAERAA